MIAIDTNLLLYAFQPAVPMHVAARRAIEAAAASRLGWGITIVNVAEFWSVATRGGDGAAQAKPVEAEAYLGGLRAAGAGMWQPGRDFGERLVATARQMQITGRRIFDLQIGLMALDNGATELWSQDRAFIAPPRLRLVHPF
ncbi:MAG: type II toxin-antitoxin system VapC family toxin [Terriglobales bacterium]